MHSSGKLYTELRQHLRARGLSLNWASSLFGVSYSTMRALCRGTTNVLSADAQSQLDDRVRLYLEEQHEAEHRLYTRIAPIVADVPRGITRAVLRTIITDLEST